MSETFEAHAREDILSAALRVAETVRNSEGSDELVSAISQRHAERGEFERAVEIADMINDPYMREKTLADIAIKCAAGGAEDYAFELLEALEDFSFQATGSAHIAAAHAARGDFDRALEIASEMEDSSSTLAEIAHQWAEKGEYERALEIVEMLDLPLYSSWSLARIADSHFRAGRADEAAELLSQALEEADSIEPSDDKANALAELALKFNEVGQGEQALEVLAQALDAASTAEGAFRDPALGQVAAAHARLKEFDDAVEIVERIDDVYQATSALVSLAAIEHEEEARRADALQLLSDAYDLVSDNMPEDQRQENARNQLLGLIAVRYEEFGQHDQALKAAASIGLEADRYQVLSAIAQRAAQAGHYDDAVSSVRTIDDESHRAVALLGVSRALISAGALEQGLEALKQAMALAEKLERPFDKTTITAQAAIVHAEAGLKDRLTPLFRQALLDTKTIASEYEKASALLSIADACSKTGHELDGEAQELVWEISAV